MIRARLSSVAERDVLEAQEWYVHQKPGLDLSFRDDLDRLLIQIRTYPESYPVVHKKIRRANLRVFPFGVFYVRRKDDVFVVGVVHHSRHPRRWKRRW